MFELNLQGIDINAEPPKTDPERQYYYIAKCRDHLQKREAELGRKLTYHNETFGCQMNFKDSEKLNGVLEAIGYEPRDDEKADFVIYNTCTVRENANDRVYGRIGYLGKLKKTRNDMIIAMCGCMMQEPTAVEKIKTSYRFVDLIFGTHNIFKLAELIWSVYEEREQSAHDPKLKKRMVIDVWKDTNEIIEELPSSLKYSFKAGVNIMFGCNNFCTYCIVPYVRGRERSRRPDDIINEIKDMVSHGVVEIMLLGQNVNSYGKNLDEPITFAELLRRVDEVEGIKRIRFMTSHPKDLSDELIEVIAASKHVCRHIHLPVQSGSNRLLKAMNRHYTREDYLLLVDKLKAKIPDIAITTDIIVGFPGETDEDFEDTLDICRKVGYDSAFTFIYSKRTGTPAAAMPDQVPEEVTSERFKRLLDVVGKCSEERAKTLTGKTLPVLVEEENRSENMLTGRLDNNLLVHFNGDPSLLGSIVNVRLNECKGFYYIGEQV
ncbi:MAG: tRNA (N6-isopentenyl adenosine(37)-C2)-methylthiotransferase MiaB [Lachnospiraceae bacterium]|nr:tRNA (N6-isopentenyl adenosine(37)-C2)-methylthiotransferase MiaB [Lachnospiraceae bacterium]